MECRLPNKSPKANDIMPRPTYTTQPLTGAQGQRTPNWSPISKAYIAIQGLCEPLIPLQPPYSLQHDDGRILKQKRKLPAHAISLTIKPKKRSRHVVTVYLCLCCFL